MGVFSPCFNFLPSTRILLNGDLRKIFSKILKSLLNAIVFKEMMGYRFDKGLKYTSLEVMMSGYKIIENKVV
jgi:hypothetical protein